MTRNKRCAWRVLWEAGEVDEFSSRDAARDWMRQGKVHKWGPCRLQRRVIVTSVGAWQDAR